jgi:hypothetical protein
MAIVKGKKLVSVSEDVIEKAAKVSREEGLPMGKLVETLLEQAIKVNKLRYRSDQMADFFDVLQTNRVLGGLFVPTEVLDFMLDKCSVEREELQKLWLESGKWTGKYLTEKFPDPISAFTSFLKLSRWDLNEVDVRSLGNNVKVQCVSTVMSLENTNMLAKFVEGALEGIGYKMASTDCLKGMLIMSFKRR